MSYKTCALLNPSTREYRILKCPYVNHNYKYKPPIACGEDEYFGLTCIDSFLSLYGGKSMSEELDVWQDGWERLMTIYNLPEICIRFVLHNKLSYCRKNGNDLLS
ncbi:hypothetical protein H5410_043089 [Solanum commersonii]|uniref:Uncharacterized protein n=1 Tax=Solanum commersonii TaxID=4109 RepID=A0A9J5XY89_SOLCO|nr:hypothetical protein H5410_043089 [Solanum commersonii]